MAAQQGGAVGRRPVAAGDEPFLLALYASTRAEELAQVEWAPGAQEAFLAQQFQAQQAHYQSHFPSGEHELILSGGEPVGRIYLERGAQKLHLLDIALLPAWRGRGIGQALMRELLEESDARGLPITLHVYRLDERVLRWYERLGFGVVGGSGMYYLLERRPAAPRGEG
jgi:ribosomal protein S18 acetylase RimI-like enzyme